MHYFILQFERSVVRTHIIIEEMSDHQIWLQEQRDRNEAEAWVSTRCAEGQSDE